MMLTIFGFPRVVEDIHIRELIKKRCNIHDFVLDNSCSDRDGTKTVRIGLANESQGNALIGFLDGYRYGGEVLRVEPYSKSVVSSNMSNDMQYSNQLGCNKYNQKMFNQPNEFIQKDIYLNTTQGANIMVQPNVNFTSVWAQNSLIDNNKKTPHYNMIQQQKIIQGGSYEQFHDKNDQYEPKFETRNQMEKIDNNYGQNQFERHSMRREGDDSKRFDNQSWNRSTQQTFENQTHDNYQERNTFNQDIIGRDEYMSGRNKHPNERDKFSPYRRPVSPHSKRWSPGRKVSPSRIDARQAAEGRMPNSSEKTFVTTDNERRPLLPRRNRSPDRRRPSPSRRSRSIDRRPVASERKHNSPGRKPVSFDRKPVSIDRKPLLSGKRHMSPDRRMNFPEKRAGSPDRNLISPKRMSSSLARRPLTPERKNFSSGKIFEPPVRSRWDKSTENRPVSPDRRPFSTYMSDQRPIIPDKRPILPTPVMRPASPERCLPFTSVRRPDHPPDRQISPAWQKRPLSPDRSYWSPNRNVLPSRKSLSPSRRQTFESNPRFTDRGNMLAFEMQNEMNQNNLTTYGRPNLPFNQNRGDSNRTANEPAMRSMSPDNRNSKRYSPSQPSEYEIMSQALKHDSLQYAQSRLRPQQHIQESQQISNFGSHSRMRSPSPSPSRRIWANERKYILENNEAPPPPIWPSSKEIFSSTMDTKQDRVNKKSNSSWEVREEHATNSVTVRKDLIDRETSHAMPFNQFKPNMESYSFDPKNRAQEAYQRDNPGASHLSKFPDNCSSGFGKSNDLVKEIEEVRRRAEEFRKKTDEFNKEVNRRNRNRSKPSLEQESKRDKAADELAKQIVRNRNDSLNNEECEIVFKELKLAILHIINEMFGNSECTFIEIILKFNSIYKGKAEDNLWAQVTSNTPSMKNLKSRASGTSKAEPKESTDRWNFNIEPLETQKFFDSNSHIMTMMPAPVLGPENSYNFSNPEISFMQAEKQQLASAPGTFNLYLCKDDFQPYSSYQAQHLKDFLVAQNLKYAAYNDGWTPSLILKGLQSTYRYEVLTHDIRSKDWLCNVDFREFSYFNVRVYTKEDLWYERAAIWLPGHSKHRKIEPLDKLKLQNKKIEGIDIEKWMLVKKIVTEKGIRVYVDIPRSAVKALEQYKMSLSYELQKVTIFLKTVAVDKDAFENGLKDESIDETLVSNAINKTLIPSINSHPNLVKIKVKGSKTINQSQARQIKDNIIYRLFKYHQDGGKSKTDFLKFGLCQGAFEFGVLAENDESKRWLKSLDLGKYKNHPLIVDTENANTCFVRWTALIHKSKCQHHNISYIHETFKQSNKGIKGLNFSLWKPVNFFQHSRHYFKYFVDIDMESVETMMKIDYNLDFYNLSTNKSETVKFEPEYSISELKEILKKHSEESKDSYVVASMDIDSEDDVICLD